MQNRTLKSEDTFIVPPDAGMLSGGRFGGKWALCWTDENDKMSVNAWSRRTGWIPLPPPPSPIARAYPLSTGMLVLCEDDGHIGFWGYGDRQWRWWHTIQCFAIMSSYHISDNHIIVYDNYNEKLMVRSFNRTGVKPICDIDLDVDGNVWVVWLDEQNEDIHLYGDSGHYIISVPYTHSNIQLVKTLVDKTDTSEGDPINRPFRLNNFIYYPRVGNPVIRINIDTGEISHTGVGYLDYCQALWSFYEQGNRQAVTDIIDFLHSIPEHLQWADLRIFDIGLKDNRPHACISTLGIYIPQKRSKASCRSSTIDARLHYLGSDEYISWLLWSNPRKYFSVAVKELLESWFPSSLIVKSLHMAFGKKVCKMLLDHVRGTDMPDMMSAVNIRHLFGMEGTAIGDLVRKCLKDEDSFVVCVGAVAAGAADEKKGRPLLWKTKKDVPIKDMLRLLGHPNEKVIKAVLNSIGMLRLRGTVRSVESLLYSDNDNIRREAVRAISRLPDVTDNMKARIETMAIRDRNADVREEAVKALGSLFRGNSTIDAILLAMCDVTFDVRKHVDELLAQYCDAISLEQMNLLMDIFCLLMISAAVDKDKSSMSKSIISSAFPGFIFSVGIEDLMETVGTAIEKKYSIEDAASLDDVPEHIIDILFRILMLLIYMKQCLHSSTNIQISTEEKEQLFENIKKIGKESMLSRSDIDILAECPKNTFNVARHAIKIHEIEPSLGKYAVLIVTYILGPEKVCKRDTDSATNGYLPVHLRLRNLSMSRQPPDICRQLTRNYAYEQSIWGLTALFTLASLGDEEAKKYLWSKIVNNEIYDCWVIVDSFMLLLDKKERLDFICSLITSDQLPVHLREWWYSHWDVIAFGSIPEDAVMKLMRDIVKDEDCSFDCRLNAARKISTTGDNRALEKIWMEKADKGEIDESNSYEYSLDMAICGHHEHMDVVRKEWLSRNDVRAFEAFAASGTEADIPAIEESVKSGWPEDVALKAIEAIRTKARKSGASGS